MYGQPSFGVRRTVCMEGTQETWHRHKKQTCFMLYPTRRKFSLEFRFRYVANGKFIKFQFCTLLDFYSFFNECLYTLQEEKFYWNLNSAISPMVNSLNLNSVYYYTFRNLSTIVYMIEFQKSKFAKI